MIQRLLWLCLAVLVMGLVVVAQSARRGVSSMSPLRPPSIERINYKTTYACEGRELQVSCEGEGVIRLARANYGRFSISLCNEQGKLDWSVNCMSYKSFLIMQDKCSQKQSCKVIVSSAMFGDPCPGTHKYLEVQYHCVKSTGSANSPKQLTPVLPTLPVLHLVNESTTLSTTQTASSSTSPPSTSVSITSTTTTTTPSPKVLSSTFQALFDPVFPSTNSPSSNEENYSYHNQGPACPATIARDLFWNWTRPGDIVIQNCPAGTTGFAKWQCSMETGVWFPETSPDLRDCRSLWLDNLRRRIESGESVINVATELALMTSSKSLFAEDLRELTSLIRQALTKTINSMENSLDLWHRYHVLRELLQSLLETLSNLLEPDQSNSWQDLSIIDRRQVAAALIEQLEASALLLADVSGKDDSFTVAKSNILLSVQVLNNPRIVDNVHFPDNTDSSIWVRMEDSLVLPAQALLDLARHGLVKVVFIAYDQVGQFLTPDVFYQPLSMPEITTQEEMFYTNVSKIINSRVISASVGRKDSIVQLTKPVMVTLRHLQEENVTNPQCVFWDFNTADWSTQGCWVHDHNRTHTVCACKHLTNFAVLMDVKPNSDLTNPRDLIRLIISIGCSICIVCLIITVICLFSVRKLKGDHIIIHRNLFLCLLVAELLYVSGIDQVSNRIFCGLFAVLLEYSLMSAFFWAFLEGFQLYVTIVEMQESEKKRSHWYYCLAYGVPALIIVISSAVDVKSYGTNYYCWLRADNYFIFSFIGPTVGILFGAIVFLCIATCILCYHFNLSTSIKSKEESKLASIKSWIRLAFILLSILALTWTTGLLVLHQQALFLAYSFTVLNSILGVYIILFYCFGNEKVREELEKFMTHQSFEPTGKKLEQPPNGTLAVDHSISTETWNCPKDGSAVLNFTAPGHPYIQAATSPKDDPSPSLSEKAFNIAPQQVFKRELHSNTLNSKWKVQEAWAKQYSSDIYNSFSDHIYETIDDETYRAMVQPVQLASDYGYGEHSDLSQHSSSSYGYDQRPLLIATLQQGRLPNGQQIYGVSRNYSLTSTPESHRHVRTHHHSKSHRRTSSDKISNLDATAVPTQTHTEKEWTPALLPDLLRCPSENPVVMAVLEGQKVVSCIQPDVEPESMLQYKLSTYC